MEAVHLFLNLRDLIAVPYLVFAVLEHGRAACPGLKYLVVFIPQVLDSLKSHVRRKVRCPTLSLRLRLRGFRYHSPSLFEFRRRIRHGCIVELALS